MESGSSQRGHERYRTLQALPLACGLQLGTTAGLCSFFVLSSMSVVSTVYAPRMMTGVDDASDLGSTEPRPGEQSEATR